MTTIEEVTRRVALADVLSAIEEQYPELTDPRNVWVALHLWRGASVPPVVRAYHQNMQYLHPLADEA